MWRAIKNSVLWNYGRTTWQYDVLCILILAFIFLTPKSWFGGKEIDKTRDDNKLPIRLIVSADNFPAGFDENQKLQRVRDLCGCPTANIAAWRERSDANGQIAAVEIDVR